MELNGYGIDTVRLVEDQEGNVGLQVVTYLVASDSAQNAYHRYMEGGEFPVIFEGEVADRIVIGVGPAEKV